MIKDHKKYLCLAFFTFLVVFATNIKAQTKKATLNEVVIKGKVAYLNPEVYKKYNMVWLKKGIGKNLKTVDSVAVASDGTFSFKIKEAKPGLYQLDILKWQTAVFWSDKNLSISSRGYDTSKVKSKNSGTIDIVSTSSATQLINLAINSRLIDNQNKSEVLDEGFAAQRNASIDSTWYKYFRKQKLYQKIEAQIEDRIKMMVSSSLKNPGSVYLLSMLDWKKNESYIVGELDKLLLANPNLSEATLLKKEISDNIEQKRKLDVGAEAPAIAYKNPNGDVISLPSLKGKYVIVDFWASWCGPCRKSIPKLKDLYTAYHAKGFEILSVSVDKDDAAWRKAMMEEDMPWLQVISPNMDKTMKEFMIQGIPTLFLIDREGKIVEKFTGYSPRLEEILKTRMSL